MNEQRTKYIIVLIFHGVIKWFSEEVRFQKGDDKEKSSGKVTSEAIQIKLWISTVWSKKKKEKRKKRERKNSAEKDELYVELTLKNNTTKRTTFDKRMNKMHSHPIIIQRHWGFTEKVGKTGVRRVA